MPLIEWNEKLSVGIDEIDEQHKKWISIINDLHDSILDGKSRDTLEKIANDMEAYTFHHFSEEEKLLEKIGYPELFEHSRVHFNFRQEISRLKNDILSRKGILSTQVMGVLKNWLLDHIMEEDMKYGEFIKKKSAK